MNFPFYTYPLIYLVSILVGLINYKKISENKYLKLFLFFLIYTFFSECIGIYVGLFLEKKNNVVYNTWNILNLFVIATILLSRIRSKIKRKLVYSFLTIFSLVTIINILFFSSYIEYLLINNSLFAKSLISLIVIIFFAEILDSDEVLYFNKSLFLWFSIGVFIYNLAFLPAYALVKYTSFSGMFRYIIFILNIIMHICFITGFIVSKKEYNS